MPQKVNRHCSILIISMLLAALVSSLHHWVAIAKNRGDYSPFAVSPKVSSLTFDETHFYAPVAKRFMSRGQLRAEVDNYERRDSSAGIAFIPAVVLGGMGRLLGSLEWAFIIADVLFPALAFGLLYAASDGLVQSLNSRLLIAWGTLLIPWSPRTFLWRGYDALLAAPEFTRTPQPEVSFVLLVLASLLLARALKPCGSLRSAVVAGFVGALIIYCYYFYALAWGIAIGLFFVLAIFWRDRALQKRLALVLGIAVIGSLPYVIATARGMSEGGQTDLLLRVGTHTHAPRVIPLICFVLGLVLIWKFGKQFLGAQEDHLRIAIFLFLLLAGFAGLNFQILSGYDAEHTHFWRRLILPMGFFLSGCWLLSTAERRWHRHHALRGITLALLICILVNACARQVYVGAHTAELQRASRPEIQLLKWVQSNVPSGSVIGTVDPNVILLIPAISDNFSYVPAGLRSLTPTGEIVDRYYELALLLGLSATEIESIAEVPSHSGTDSHLLWALRVYAETLTATPQDTSKHSHLMEMTAWAQSPQTFSEGYSRYHRVHADQKRRLDYVVDSSGAPIPAAIAQTFVNSRIIYANQRYQLIALR